MPKFDTRNCVYLCIWIFVINKVVEGSGSEGTPKYVGEGVTYGVFLGTLAIFHTCMPADAPHQLALTSAYVIMT